MDRTPRQTSTESVLPLMLMGFLVALLALLPVAPAAAQAESGAESDPPAETAPDLSDKVTFDVRLSEENGGGRVKGTAGDFQLEADQYLVATGGVVLEYQDLRLEARRLRVDIPANVLTAEGDVILDEGPRRIEAESLEWDLGTRTGRFVEATAFVAPDYYFSGAEVRKTGDLTFSITDGVFTSCEGDVPAWSIALSRATVTMEEYARIKNARLKFKRLPVFYVPYLVWPATTERSSGWLVPKPGWSSRRGAQLSLAYYQTLGRSADTTFYFDLSSDEYLGIGNELRYRPSEGTNGLLEAYFLSEPEDAFENEPIFDPSRERGDDRWKLVWEHRTDDLWGDWRGVIDLQLYSDFDYLKDVERSVRRQTRAFVYSNAYLSKNAGPHSFNLMVDQRERILGNRSEDIRRQLPEAEYRLRSTQLGNTPIYFQAAANLHYFSIEQEPPPDSGGLGTTQEYGRIDLAPTFSFPLSTLPWLSAKVELGGRVTHYTESRPGDDTPAGEAGEEITRSFETAAVEIVGPSFSRVFGEDPAPGQTASSEDGEELGRFSKLKHIVEPRIEYSYVGEFEDAERILLFDEIDTFRSRNFAKFSLINRLLAKPADEDEGGAFEIASFELAQIYNFDDSLGQTSADGQETSDGPLLASLRLNPSRDTSVKADLTYDTLQSEIEALSLTGDTRIGRHGFGVTWFTRWRETLLPGDEVDFVTSSDQLRLFTSLALGSRLTFDAQVSLDLEASETLNQRFVFDWQGSCYHWILELRETRFRGEEERDVRFLLDLKNVGTFLDVNDSF